MDICVLRQTMAVTGKYALLSMLVIHGAEVEYKLDVSELTFVYKFCYPFISFLN